jgi:hypothetical protein
MDHVFKHTRKDSYKQFPSALPVRPRFAFTSLDQDPNDRTPARAAVHIVFWSNADLLSLFQALLISVLPDSRATVPRYGGRAILGTVSEACNNKALK